MEAQRRAIALARSCHPGPALAVTALSTAYAVSVGLGPPRAVLAAAAVLAGQLSIGWGNDLIDVERDRTVGRDDKPLATRDVPASVVRKFCIVATLATAVLSLGCGLAAGFVHLGCVAAGWAYNAGMKATALSWLPFAVAFGGLPVFVNLTGPGVGLPPWWIPTAGALLGVGAHLVNVLPDLGDDRATGVRGLAHRVGSRGAALLAVVNLAAATVILAIGTREMSGLVIVLVLVAVAGLAALALIARGRVPFQAAVGIAVLDVLLLVMAP